MIEKFGDHIFIPTGPEGPEGSNIILQAVPEGVILKVPPLCYLTPEIAHNLITALQGLYPLEDPQE